VFCSVYGPSVKLGGFGGEVVLVGQRWLWWVDLCSSPAAPMNGDSAELNGIESVGFAE